MSIVVDIGANVGAHTLLASHLVGRSGVVHAIEASPRIFAQLRENLALNRADNVCAYCAAVTAAPCTVDLVHRQGDANLGATGIVMNAEDEHFERKETGIPDLPLPDIVPLDHLRKARLIKIDVEGAEWQVIQGMRSILPELAHNAEIIVEVTRSALDTHGATMADFLKIFEAAGFVAFQIPNEYAVSFYFDPPSIAPAIPLHDLDIEQVDLLFRRLS